MKIGIDTLGCNHSKSGMGAYILNFISNLPEDLDKNKIEIVLFGLEIDKYIYTSDNGLEYLSVDIEDNIKAEQKWHNLKINKFAKKNNINLIIFLSIEKVFPKNCKTFKSAAIANSVVFSDSNHKQHKLLKKALKNINQIIACSNYIKQNLVDNGLNNNKISVIYNGVDHKMFYPMIDLDEDVIEINPFSIKRPYFIYASRLSGPDKKHIQLIQAFNLFKSRNQGEYRLVIAGDDDIYSQKVHEAAFTSEFANEILFTGHFPYESFPKLYAGSLMCIIPAVNEGAGLSLLEAMACGIPVLCSNQGALKEFGGVAPVYFDSDDISSMATAMEAVVLNQDFREKMIKDGLEQASKFNWNETVKSTLEIIL